MIWHIYSISLLVTYIRLWSMWVCRCENFHLSLSLVNPISKFDDLIQSKDAKRFIGTDIFFVRIELTLKKKIRTKMVNLFAVKPSTSSPSSLLIKSIMMVNRRNRQFFTTETIDNNLVRSIVIDCYPKINLDHHQADDREEQSNDSLVHNASQQIRSILMLERLAFFFLLYDSQKFILFFCNIRCESECQRCVRSFCFQMISIVYIFLSFYRLRNRITWRLEIRQSNCSEEFKISSP